MDDRLFYERFTGLLEVLKEKNELEHTHDALILWYGESILSLDPDDVKDRIVRDSHAEGVDAVLIDQERYDLLFVQSRTVESFEKTRNNLGENTVKSVLTGIRLLMADYKGTITPALENLVDEYHDLDRKGIYKTKVVFLTLTANPVSYKYVEDFRKDFPNVAVEFLNFANLKDLYINRYLLMTPDPPEKVSFEVVTGTLAKDTPHKSRVFTCKGKELAKIYNDNGDRLFERNVRLSLSQRLGSINRQIHETAVDSDSSQYFWYFNNGITIVCNEIREAASGSVINLLGAQIINGAQTTYALYDAFEAGQLQDDIEILIKAIEATDKSFVESVTLYTNSQNPIRLRDLCSNDAIQIKVQRILGDTYGYFYERKRGELDTRYPTPSAKRNQLGSDYKVKVVSNENAAQSFLAMYLDKPAQAKSEKARIFVKGKSGFYYEVFNERDSLLPEKLLASWVLLKYIEHYKKEYRRRYKAVEQRSEPDRAKVYRFDFLLHGEYFILDIFRDFLEHRGFNLNSKNGLTSVIDLVRQNDHAILEIYSEITGVFADYFDAIKEKPGYYHNKFFKNEKSIGLIREYCRQRYDFITLI